MARFQPLRGNPESKLSTLLDDFSGGINLLDEDDFVGSDQLRMAQNINIDVEGNITNRKGWIKNNALNDLFMRFESLPEYLGIKDRHVYVDNYVPFVPNTTPLLETLQRRVFPMNVTNIDKEDFLVFEVYVTGRLDTSGNYRVGVNGTDYTIPDSNTDGFYNYEIPFENILNGTNSIEIDIAPYRYEGMEVNIFVYPKSEEDLIRNGMSSVQGCFLYSDKYNQFRQLLSSETFDDFVDNYSHPNADPLPTPPEALVTLMPGPRFRFNAPLVFVTIYMDYRHCLHAHTGHVYNGYIEETSHTLVGTPLDLRTTNNYVEGDGNFLTNIYHATWRGELVFVAKGLNLVVGLKDVSIDTPLDVTRPRQFSVFEVNHYGESADLLVDNPIPTENSAYKPSPWEVRNVGFNVLGSDPLTWVDASDSSIVSIRGVFLTYTRDGINAGDVPINFIPSNEVFVVNMLYSGPSLTPGDFSVKFYTFANNEKTQVPVAALSSTVNAGIMSYSFTLQSVPTTEVELEITGPSSLVFRDYFNVGDITDDLIPVKSLDVGNYNVVSVYDRVVYYGGNTIWWSDINYPSYVPNYNFARLPFSEGQDEITAIEFFRSSYMIFTRNRIFKLSGGFDPGTMRIDIVSEYIGCVAPKTIKMVENELLFLSNRGLYALKSETFRADQENIRPIGEKISPIFESIPFNLASAFVKDEQYVLYLNTAFISKDYSKELVIKHGGYEVQAPDVVRYYYQHESFVFDYFPDNKYTHFVFSIGNNLITLRKEGIHTFEEGTSDFDEPYKVMFETAGLSLGYPAHEKKIKKLWVKMRKENFEQTVRISTFMDGFLVFTIDEFPEGDVRNADLPGSISDQRLVRLPSLKGRNLIIRVMVDDNKPISFNSLALEWKLGKMRG